MIFKKDGLFSEELESRRKEKRKTEEQGQENGPITRVLSIYSWTDLHHKYLHTPLVFSIFQINQLES